MTRSAAEPPSRTNDGPPALIEPGQPRWLVPVRVLGLLVALVAIGSGALSVTAEFVTSKDSGTATFSQPVQRLRVVADSGDVRVRVATGTTISVRTVSRAAFGRPRLTSAVRNGTLQLGQGCDRDWWLPGECSVDFEVTMPAGVAIELTTQTGDILVDGAQSDLLVSTDTGDITVLDTGSDRVTVNGSVGDVRLQFRAAPERVGVQTDVGDIRIRVPDDQSTYLIRGRTDVGTARIDDRLRNGRSSRTIEAGTNTGDLTISAG